jgi:hypothetical protein
MNSKLVIPLCAAITLLTACGSRDRDQPKTNEEGVLVTPGTTDATDGTNTAPPPDPTATSPGAAPGEPATVPPDSTTQPANPPPSGGG